MENVNITFNYIKHSSQNPIRQWTINSLYEVIIEELRDLNISTILDSGCGEGFLLNRLQEEAIGKSLMGIDISEDAVNLGKLLFPNLDLRVGNIYKLPLESNSYDIVICTEVLEHLKDPKSALKEIVRVSKKYVILSVPNEPIFSLKNLLVGRNISRLGSSKGHLNLWTSWGFKKFVEQQKVSILKNKYPFPFTLLFLQKGKI